MSGGFFRGTSADQDTRFSNKHAKLLKTQKFASELDHQVDMSKVKMDVMKPWIATRVTELLGFEDEVLINFIYGLLDAKEVDGKYIQIQLTGFMEKNTIKFMRELWSLLLSAQQNASGVPQQFLDAKEAEIQQRKAEEARIAQEIQKKREKDGRDTELAKHKMMAGDTGNSRFHGDSLGSALNNPNVDAEKEKELDLKHSSRTKSREHRRPRSTSLSPRGRQRSISPRRRSPSPSRQRSLRRSASPRRSVSPRRHSPRIAPSVSRRRSPYSRRSPSVPRSPSPRRRFPIRRRSPPPGRRRSPSPYRRRSPARAPRRSPSPARRRSPPRHRLPADRHRSPSPGRRRPRSPSPVRRRPRSPSPRRHRPRSPGRRQSLSPHRSPQLRSPKRQRKSPISIRTLSANRPVSPQRRRSSSPHSRSPNRSRRSLSRDAEKGTNDAPSTKGRDLAQRNQERSGRESPDFEHRRLTKSLRSPTNDAERDSTRGSPLKDTGKHMPSQDSTNTSGDEEEGGRARENARKANSSRRISKDFSSDLQLKEVNVDNSIPGEKPSSRSRQDGGKDVPKKYDDQLSDSSEDALDGRRMRRQGDSPDDSRVKRQSPSRAGDSYPKDGINIDRAKTDSLGASYDAIAAKKYSGKVDEASQSDGGSPLQKAKKRTHDSKHIDRRSSGSEESEKHRSQSEKRRHKKGHKHKKHYDDSSDSDSDSDDKESKRRRREEKKLRKEERRLRREERHRRRADRHASKQRLKYAGSPLSDLEKDRQSGSDADVGKKGSYTPREEPDPNKLEIELRQRALESLAKKSKHVVTPSSDVEKDRESDTDADVRKRVS
ncbi:hypothetical protein CFC21_058072 [Triticum aestivum]|uniref:PWI domain-containing protein n=3 Tax=Triticum TaxID=4564 RepID=A0A9R0T516_TRITD|nr:serine/arginine repetitive matrix protein 1-like [Triticum aestivum]KAF7049554.1 hypothetical protein CFC21_058072 [Triticum aestivum]VAI07305.1 unnamed protein product [Triticum turgidum subsp. durum]